MRFGCFGRGGNQGSVMTGSEVWWEEWAFMKVLADFGPGGPHSLYLPTA